MRRYLHQSITILFILALLVLFSVSAAAWAQSSDVTGARAVTAQLLADALEQQAPPAVPEPGEEPVSADLTAKAWRATFTSSEPATAVAAPSAPANEAVPLGEALALLKRAVEAKSWPLAACALVLGLVWGVRRFGAAWAPWLRTDAAGIVLSLLTAGALELAAALAAGTPFSVTLLLGVLVTAAAASGIFSWTRPAARKFEKFPF